MKFFRPNATPRSAFFCDVIVDLDAPVLAVVHPCWAHMKKARPAGGSRSMLPARGGQVSCGQPP
jgi:hypothetical protein